MPALNFKKEFAELVESGQKRQTFRPVGKRQRFKRGDPVICYTGQRTKACRYIGGGVCASVTYYVIFPAHKELRQHSSGPLSPEEVEDLARADGFVSSDEFFAFFRLTYGCMPLEIQLIKW